MARPKEAITYPAVPLASQLFITLQLCTTTKAGYVIAYQLDPRGPATIYNVYWIAKSRRIARKLVSQLAGIRGKIGFVCWWNRALSSWYYEQGSMTPQPF